MSSSNLAIEVNNLSKAYQIYDTPRDRLKQFFLPRFQRWLKRPVKQYFREFKALDNVSFKISRGETVGIIGRNGSGKSTLLQLICGTLHPSSGNVVVNGRVAALLELGSGFNPEFTGKENIYLNAGVLGLSRAQIEQRYQSIIDFADIGEFIEQPIKTYSSGMIVRLAFAVIAHVDADILVVDEALAVGDAVFTQKCMRFIRAFQKRGTLLFVSHDMAAVQNLCRSSLWLNKGKVNQHGSSKAVAEAYLKFTLQDVYGDEAKLTKNTNEDSASNNKTLSSADAVLKPAVDYSGELSVNDNLVQANGWTSGAAEILSLTLEAVSPDIEKGVYEGGEKVRMLIHAKAHQELNNPILGFLVRDKLGQDLFGENTLSFTALTPCPVFAGREFFGEFQFRLPMLPNGQYAVMASVADGDLYDNVQHHFLHDALIINVASSKVRWGLVGRLSKRLKNGSI